MRGGKVQFRFLSINRKILWFLHRNGIFKFCRGFIILATKISMDIAIIEKLMLLSVIYFFHYLGTVVCGYSTTKYSSVDHESNFRRNRYLFWNIYVTLHYNSTGKCYSKWLGTDCRLKFKPKPPIILILVFPCLHIFSYLTVYINFNKKMIIIANIFTFFFIKH